VGSDLPSTLDRQTLPRVLTEHGQQLQCSTVMCPAAHEVVRPDVILMEWPEPDARAVAQPQPTSFRLPPGHLQPLLMPDPLNTLVVHMPVLDV